MGLKFWMLTSAIKDADICMILVPDELQADLYNDFLEKKILRRVLHFLFAHGLAIHFQLINQEMILMFS